MRTVMAQINQSAGIPDQAYAAVTRLAQLEAIRQRQLVRGQVSEAGRTLQGMAEVFGNAPTLEELRATFANRFTNGSMISGLENSQRKQNGQETTYSAANATPRATRDWIERHNLHTRVKEAVPVPLAPFVQGGVQAAAYYYATAQQRIVGAGLGAVVELSTAEKARNMAQADERATYLKAAATFSGYGSEMGPRYTLGAAAPTPPPGSGKAPGADLIAELQKAVNNPAVLDWATNAALTGWWWANPSADEINSFYCLIPPDIRAKNEVKKHFVNLMKAGPTFGQPDRRKGAPLDANCTGIRYGDGTTVNRSGKSWVFKPEYLKNNPPADQPAAGSDNTMLIVGGVAAVAIIALLMRK